MDYEFRPGDLAVVSNKMGIAKEFRGLMCRIVSVKNYGIAVSWKERTLRHSAPSLPRCQSVRRKWFQIFSLKCEVFRKWSTSSKSGMLL